FEGETAGEILMKHLTSPPDLSKVPSAFAPILEKALCKNPANRFQNIADMSRRVAALAAKQAAPVEVAIQAAVITEPLPYSHGADENAEGSRSPDRTTLLLELAGSLLLAFGLAGLFSFVWNIVAEHGDWRSTMATFCVTALCSAAVLIPAKFWK